MALSILILCICSMTSFNVVASRRTTERTTTEQPYSGPLLDFGFSRLIDDLVSANDSFTNRKAIFAFFAEVKNQLKPLSGSRFKSVSEFTRSEKENQRLNWYLDSAKRIETQYDLIEWHSMENNFDKQELRKIAVESMAGRLWDARCHFIHTDEDTGLNFMKLLIENTKNKSADACSYVKQSRKYEIYEIYHKLVITTVKLFAMRMYASHLRGLDSSKKRERTEYERILGAFNNVAVPAIAEASSEMFSCDGAKTGTGKKFIELKWLFNPISINEIYLKEDAPRCWGTCPEQLRAVETEMVITGIRFVEKNQTIYLSIQEGELRPNGTIDKSTVAWQPVNEIDWKSPFITEYDYVTITHDLKSVNLDTLVVSTDRVLTGIQLHVQGSHLALKIKSNAFNYSTGILRNKTNTWQSYSPMPRQEITMTAPDSPFFMDHSVVDTRENTYVTFQKTDYEKDAAQPTVPVIDALPVAPNPAVPLSGVGLYFSGKTGYAGFIGFKAVTYDFSKVVGH